MRKHVHTYASILAGGILIAVGLQLFLVPHQLIIGGITGSVMIINHFVGGSMGLLIFLVNAPIFLIALLKLGRFFLMNAFLGVIVCSVFVDILASFELVITENLMLAAIYAGLIIGTGIALLYRVGSASGGVDILARLIRLQRPDLSVGLLVFLIDLVIILVGAIVFGQIEMPLYAGISIFMLKWSIDTVLRMMGDESEKTKVETKV